MIGRGTTILASALVWAFAGYQVLAAGDDFLAKKKTIVIDGNTYTIETKLPEGASPLGPRNVVGRGNIDYVPPAKSEVSAEDATSVIGLWIGLFGWESERSRTAKEASQLAGSRFEKDPYRDGVAIEVRSYENEAGGDSALPSTRESEVQELAGNTMSEVIYDYVISPNIRNGRFQPPVETAILFYDRSGGVREITGRDVDREVERLSNPRWGDAYEAELRSRISERIAFNDTMNSLFAQEQDLIAEGDTAGAQQVHQQADSRKEQHEQTTQQAAQRDHDADRTHELGEKSAAGTITKDEQKELDDDIDHAERSSSTAVVNPNSDNPAPSCAVCGSADASIVAALDDGGGNSDNPEKPGKGDDEIKPSHYKRPEGPFYGDDIPFVCDVCVPGNIALLRSDQFLGNFNVQSTLQSNELSLLRYNDNSRFSVRFGGSLPKRLQLDKTFSFDKFDAQTGNVLAQ